MLSTKTIVCGLDDIPWDWPFQHYLQLPEILNGQDIKIKSVFNPAERTPSFCVYFDRRVNRYKFKDFSTDKQGDAVTLVKEMFSLTTRGEAAFKIIEDYNQYLINNPDGHVPKEFKEHQKFKVTNFAVRSWTTDDERYWTKYSIGSKLLEKYCVRPLENYVMSKEEDGERKELTIQGPRIYGYFRKDGLLYKVYQPMTRDCKFINVVDYIQGTDQLTMNVPYLIITSSLKDLMAFAKLGYKNAESVAPNSENTLIQEHVIISYRLKYKKIITLFDNDEAGIRSMEKYKAKYDIPYVLLKLEKDLSDSIEKWGIEKTREVLTPIIKTITNV
jgi:hypothetical protein